MNARSYLVDGVKVRLFDTGRREADCGGYGPKPVVRATVAGMLSIEFHASPLDKPLSKSTADSALAFAQHVLDEAAADIELTELA